MTDVEKICKDISKELDIEYDTVYDVCMEVFKFTKEVMLEEKDTHNILFNKLFKFKLKKRFKNDKSNVCKPPQHDSK